MIKVKFIDGIPCVVLEDDRGKRVEKLIEKQKKNDPNHYDYTALLRFKERTSKGDLMSELKQKFWKERNQKK